MEDDSGEREEATPDPRLTRRGLLTGAGLGSAIIAAGAAGGFLAAFEETVEAAKRPPKAKSSAPQDRRLAQAFEVRVKAAQRERDLGAAAHLTNGEEESLPGRVACYSKGLPHDRNGNVDAKAYDIYLGALRSARPEDFERIPLGGFVKLANPQSAWSFELIGPDSSQVPCPPAPGFASAEQAGEIVELYWQALLRDVPFTEYGSHPLAAKAAAELSANAAFTGPRRDGKVTPETLFRGSTAGDLAGPYVSQFLWKIVPFLPIKIEQKIRTAVPAVDYMTDFDGWLAIQNGSLSGVNRFDPAPRYIRNGRDLGEYVHRDFTYQSFVSACLIALKAGTQPDGGNPYKHSRTQGSFTTFGQPFLFYLLAVVTQAALKACWYEKWIVHRRLRPEEYAGRVEAHASGRAKHPLPDGLLDSAAVAAVRERFKTALLPQAYPEACPTHPSYPAGHAVISGACATVLKACLDESHILPEPVQASADGLSLQPWKGADLTVGGELDKLAANICIGRDFAGLHWRTDALAGLHLGEEVAIRALEELSLTGNELFSGWSLKRFDGRRVTVG
ncbi:MAG: vanadium-dependent haloperoxidase [Thermoanaerobaculia bacterium]